LHQGLQRIDQPHESIRLKRDLHQLSWSELERILGQWEYVHLKIPAVKGISSQPKGKQHESDIHAPNPKITIRLIAFERKRLKAEGNSNGED
jgi:hypothetical protein